LLRSLSSDIIKSIQDEFGKESDQVCERIRGCIANRDYMTICQLGTDGSTSDVNVSILQALMTGAVKFSTGW